MTSTPLSLLPAERNERITLPDGRTFGYAVLGAATGPTVVVPDGPGSRGLARIAAAAAAEHGIRLIAPDRPGFGESSPHDARTIAGVVVDLVGLVDAIDVRRFGILGQSGGTPYAIGLAGALPDRVS